MLKKLKNSQNYQKFLLKRENFVKKAKKFFLGTLRLDKLRHPIIRTTVFIKWCFRWASEVLINGILLFIGYEGITSDYFPVRVVGYGIAMYVASTVLKKLWKNYTLYKFRVNKISVIDQTETRYETYTKAQLKKKGVIKADI